MIKKQLLDFACHWLVSSLGIWLSYRFFFSATDDLAFCLLSGLIFALFNSFARPLLTLITLPLSLLTLGLSTVIINAGLAALTFWLINTPDMTWSNVLLGSISLILLNGLVNLLILPYTKK